MTGVNNLKTVEFDVGVYVVGPPFGDDPVFIGSSAQVLALLDDIAGGNDQEAICADSNIKDTGITVIENGKKVIVTTEGKCVKLPKNNSSCDLPPETDNTGKPVATGISMLTETELISFEIKGFDLPTIPGFPNPLDSIVDSFVQNICYEHVRKDSADFEAETDVCFDITELVGSIPGVSGSVTMAMKSNSKSTIVDNCANTGADTIIDLVSRGLQ